jgi:hypothetical protein
VVAALTLAGCGRGDDEPAGPLPTARFAIPSGASTPTTAPPAPSPSATDAVSVVEPAEDTPAARKAFTLGMADYCTTYYTLLAAAEEAHPELDPASDSTFERAAAAASARAERRLASLRPPPDLAEPFTEFVAVSHEITEAHDAMATWFANTGQEGPGGADFDRAALARRPLATALGAPICDGKLPPAQRTAVIDAVRTVETSHDSAEVCREGVTPGFLQYTWAVFADPVRACILTRDLTLADLPTDIEVDQVTGSDGITATVDYTHVGGCDCGSAAQARLHFVDGAWRVSSISY